MTRKQALRIDWGKWASKQIYRFSYGTRYLDGIEFYVNTGA